MKCTPDTIIGEQPLMVNFQEPCQIAGQAVYNGFCPLALDLHGNAAGTKLTSCVPDPTNVTLDVMFPA